MKSISVHIKSANKTALHGVIRFEILLKLFRCESSLGPSRNGPLWDSVFVHNQAKKNKASIKPP